MLGMREFLLGNVTQSLIQFIYLEILYQQNILSIIKNYKNFKKPTSSPKTSVMKFTKESKKYFTQQLKGGITNFFQFNIKSLYSKGQIIQEPMYCTKCGLPLTAAICFSCKTDNGQQGDKIVKGKQGKEDRQGELRKWEKEDKQDNGLQMEEKQLKIEKKIKGEDQENLEKNQKVWLENFVYREKMGEDIKMQESMILLVDLSGSMSCSYRSHYKKVNEQLVARILGQKNFQYLKKKIGLQKVMNNYTVYQMLLSEGESARNIAQMVRMQQTSKTLSSSPSPSSQSPSPIPQSPPQQYISRKQIIQIAVSKCISILKSRNPQTHLTIIYFNSALELPIDFFNDKLVIPGLEDRTVEEMVQLGYQYGDKLTKMRAKDVGEGLAMHLTKANQNGQTALGPALAFCFGVAKKWKYSLHQITVITDGMSNIGFGQIEDELHRQQAMKFYQQMALQYAKPLNCVVNVLTFQDCCIGYDVLDQMVSITGGIPCQIQFTQKGGQKIVNDETFNSISFKMITAFCQYANKLCYQIKTTIICNNDKIKLSVPNQLKPFVTQNKGHTIVLQPGIRSSCANYLIQFSVDPDTEIDGQIKFLILNEFSRNSKKNLSATMDKIKLTKGTKQQSQKQQALSLQKQIKQKLKSIPIFQQDLSQYQNISIKLQQNQNVNIVNKMDKDLLEKFRNKKENLENQFKNVDKLTREKMSMRSRAQKTYREERDDFDDGFV